MAYGVGFVTATGLLHLDRHRSSVSGPVSSRGRKAMVRVQRGCVVAGVGVFFLLTGPTRRSGG